MQIETVPIEKLKPTEYNPRRMSKSQHRKLRRSIQEFGFVEPIVVNNYPGRENIIIGGHQRLEEAIELHMKEVPVHYVSLTQDKEKLLNISLNKITGDWDDEKLIDLLTDLDNSKADLTLTGFEDNEIRRLLKEDIKEDDLPTDIEKRCQTGDVWILGNHRLMCGDATKFAEIRKLMNNQQADMVFTDPPYNVAYIGKTEDALTIQNDQMSKSQFDAFLWDSFMCIREALKKGGAIYVCHADSKGLEVRQAFNAASFELKQVIIWSKQHFVMGRQDYQWRHEPILYGWQEGTHQFYGGHSETTVWNVDRPAASRDHPTMKPVELCARAIRNSSKTDDIVLDPFGGSGSTLIAAEQLGRKCYMMEIDSTYCDVILRRWEKWTGNTAVKA